MKSQRVYQFLVVLLILIPAKIFSQQQLPRVGHKSPHKYKFLDIREPLSSDKDFISAIFLESRNLQVSLDVRQKFSYSSDIRIVNPGFTLQNLPFFCEKEIQIEKATLIPFRFRLGSLEQVNQIEGKEKPVLLGH